MAAKKTKELLDLKSVGIRGMTSSTPSLVFMMIYSKVYKFKFDLQPGSLTDQVAGEHQPSYEHP